MILYKKWILGVIFLKIQEIDKNFDFATTLTRKDISIYNVLEEPFKIYGLFLPENDNDSFHRLPYEVAENVNDGVKELNLNTSGGRVRFATDSDYIAIRAEIHTHCKVSFFSFTGIMGFDLYVEKDGNKAVILEVNSETDFVSKNEEFTEMIKNIGQTILNSDAKTLEEANELAFEDGTIKDYVVAKTAKIGEKLDFRRLAVVEKNDDENFGKYLHMGGKIAVLTLLEGASSEVAKDVCMHVAAMNPKYLNKDNQLDTSPSKLEKKSTENKMLYGFPITKEEYKKMHKKTKNKE